MARFPSPHVMFAPLSPANEVTESAVAIGLAPPSSAIVTMENGEAGSPKVGLALVITSLKSSDEMIQCGAIDNTVQV